MRVNKKWVSIVFIVATLCWVNSASAAMIYVSQEKGVADETSIQQAINDAKNGDTVLVADGIYTGEFNTNLTWDGNKKHITVKSENGPENCIIDCEGSNRAFSFDFTSQNENDVIEGFTIKNGYVGYGAGINCEGVSPNLTNCIFELNRAYYGGGVGCYGASPTITNCVFTGNEVDESGGGIFCENSSPTITDCTFTGNEAYWDGGGIACCDESSPSITNCIITENGAFWGGGISCYEASPTITNCTIKENDAEESGGGIDCYFSSPAITGCTIKENFCEEEEGSAGGGISCYNSFPTIASCVIEENGAFWGGGIAAILGDMVEQVGTKSSEETSFSITISDCMIKENLGVFGAGITIFDDFMVLTGDKISDEISFSRAITNCVIKENNGIFGGGIAILGGMMGLDSVKTSEEFSFTTTVTNCTIVENYEGCGVYIDGIFGVMGEPLNKIPDYEDYFPTINNCTIAENEAEGICCENSFLTVKNSILWGNGLNGEKNGGGEEGPEIILLGSFLGIDYSDIENGVNGIFEYESDVEWGDNNIDSNPLFVKVAHNITDVEDKENIRYHLSKNSPCRDSGTNEGAPENDIDGQKRPFGDTTDIGSDEYVWAGSVNSEDGQVNLYLGEGAFTEFETVNGEDLPDEGKPELTFPFGFSSFRIIDIEEGGTVDIVLTCSENVPTNAEYWKYDETKEEWYQLPLGSNDGDNIVILTLTDGGNGDADGVANGVIIDPGGIGWGGAQGSGSDGSGGDDLCFIENMFGFAKANSEEIMVVRRFRDEKLLANPVGCLFVSSYYKTSPVLVRITRECPVLGNIAREVLKPIIWVSKGIVG